MELVLAILLLASPSILLIAIRFLLRANVTLAIRLIWSVVGTVWAVAIYLWISYAGQQTDVGLMVQGILAYSVSGSALAATVVAFVLVNRR